MKRLQEPYLTWTGKAERTSFEVDTVSLHVHERIDPRTILETVRKRQTEGSADPKERQLDLFAPPFEELSLAKDLEFFQHEKGWARPVPGIASR